ncbi:Sjogren's syndrome/scleroderma autoantigen 1 family protein [Methanothermococcus okinawensis]|uniref:Sjogrens syndrome scleroderma autoantigen 1 n=1 Tax=Methanothermococcus okinawensis (strain DSM 14208 / JCM 11175 / IH1) TaxID=647113 RepID=F8ALZ2_METOI|nr:Sjogren's syndrome/scleroderma autoantigen 1 family protein [Methanothermococcus okinawensis]AEH06667.1 Sjogrens syndrome scleroderma autoantigen 1 [Methanothermococcus okinawensis IH1]
MQHGSKYEKENDVVKIASKEMLKGSKMLGKHCKKCGFPLFEDKKGNVYCPNCEYKRIINKDTNNKIENEMKKEAIFKQSPSETKEKEINNINNMNNVNINNIINKKINYLFKKLDDEYEVGRIVEIGIAIEMLIKLNNDLNNSR